jgi:hypothetical protein
MVLLPLFAEAMTSTSNQLLEYELALLELEKAHSFIEQGKDLVICSF